MPGGNAACGQVYRLEEQIIMKSELIPAIIIIKYSLSFFNLIHNYQSCVLLFFLFTVLFPLIVIIFCLCLSQETIGVQQIR